MPRRALLVGINDYRSISDLRGCINDIDNIRDVLKSILGFRNNDIRVLEDARATKANILHRLNYMVDTAQPGDFLIFHFSGHGSQIRDRDGDELLDHMDELLCPWDMDWDGTYILDDDLDVVLSKLPDGVNMEVILDCCHSGVDTRQVQFAPSRAPVEPDSTGNRSTPRFLPPPRDIQMRWEGEEEFLKATRGFSTVNRAGRRSTAKYVLWTGCQANQTSADAYIDGNYHGAFTYYFCQHMRQTQGNISRKQLIERVRESIRTSNVSAQVPMVHSPDKAMLDKRPFQFPNLPESERLLFYTRPNMQGPDVYAVQEALKSKGYDIDPDGVFGPYTRVVVMKFQARNQMVEDGVVGPAVRAKLFG